MNTSSKISYLISHYPAISHTFILREVRHLRSMGVELDVASINDTDRPDEKLTEEEKIEKAITLYIKNKGLSGLLKAFSKQFLKQPITVIRSFFFAARLNGLDLKALLYNLFYLAEALIVAEWMADNDSHHIHVHFSSEAATVGLLVKQLNGCSYSIYVHGPDEFYDVSKYVLSKKIENADFIFCISDFARSQLMKLSDFSHWHKFIVRRLGVDTEKFTPTTIEKQGPATILCVGRLCPAKGQHILLMAAKAMLDRDLDFRIIFVGDGPDRSSLETLASDLKLNDYVEFTGAVNHDEVHHYYQQADIFCLPSFAEGIPIVLMEAMAQEIPCVTTHITGIPELIDDGQDGLLTTPSNAENLAAALQQLILDKKFAGSIGAAGREKILSKYNLGNNTTRFAEKFVALLDQKSS